VSPYIALVAIEVNGNNRFITLGIRISPTPALHFPGQRWFAPVLPRVANRLFFMHDDRPRDLVATDLQAADALTVVAPTDLYERAARVPGDHEDRLRHTASLPLKLSKRANTTLP
jgi:hypothetical protein